MIRTASFGGDASPSPKVWRLRETLVSTAGERKEKKRWRSRFTEGWVEFRFRFNASLVLIFNFFSTCAGFSCSERCLHSEPARRQTASADGADALQPADGPKNYRRVAIGRPIHETFSACSSFRGFLASRFPCVHWLPLRRAAPLRFNGLHGCGLEKRVVVLEATSAFSTSLVSVAIPRDSGRRGFRVWGAAENTFNFHTWFPDSFSFLPR